MTWRRVAALALLLHAASSVAAQLTPLDDGGDIALLIEATSWPQTLRKDLTSGLTNRILIRVRLVRAREVIQQRAVEIAVKYDLWDERFSMGVFIDGVDAGTQVVRNTDEMLAVLQKLRLPGLFAARQLAGAPPCTITTEVLLNPIDRERAEKIRKWVAENSAGPTDMGAHASSKWGVAIFNSIFEQYSSGEDLAAAWRETSTSAPFTLEDLDHERR